MELLSAYTILGLLHPAGEVFQISSFNLVENGGYFKQIYKHAGPSQGSF